VALYPHPVWPVLLLALVQVVDGVLCIRPASFVAECYDAVHWPRRLWWLMPPLKLAAAVGLIAGIWVPYLGAMTTVALVAYFVVAITMHIRARDIGRRLFVNATGMLVLCVAVGVFSFLV